MLGLLTTGKDIQYSDVVSKFTLFSSLSVDLTQEMREELRHVVITPKQFSHDNNGKPTSELPDMIGTRKNVDHELVEKTIHNKVVQEMTQGIENSDKVKEEEEIFDEVSSDADVYNESLKLVLETISTFDAKIYHQLNDAIKKLDSDSQSTISSLNLAKLSGLIT